jgi:glutathione synthase
MIVALQIDPISLLNYESDTSILLGLELQARGFEIYTYMPHQLSLINGKLIAHGRFIKLNAHSDKFYQVMREESLELAKVKLVLMRQDPPFNMDYITATYLLDLIKDKVLVVNNPTAVRNNIEKLIVYRLPQYLPPSIISQNIEELTSFWRKHKDVIIKPLYGHGGNFIKHIKEKDDFLGAALEALEKHKHIVVQKFLPAIMQGDTRVAMVNGKVLQAMRRVPADGKIESNLAAGGKAIAHELTVKEKEICNAVGALLKQENIFFAGVDLIEEHLIEINITSPTGLLALNHIYGDSYETKVIDALLAKLS